MSKYTPSWNYLGINLSFATNVQEALETADLAFTVQKSPLLAITPNTMVPDMVGTFREDTGAVLGVVGKDYGVVNNDEAFAFADLIEDLQWRRGGYTASGLAFLVADLPVVEIADEKYIPHIVFQNSFNGRWNLKGQVVLEDVSAGYTVMLPDVINGVSVADIKIRHSKRAEDRIRVAQQALSTVRKYITDFTAEATSLSQNTIDAAALEVVVSDLFPIKPNDSDRVRDNKLKLREEFLQSYNAPENTRWFGTAWGIVKAFADFTAKAGYKNAQKNKRKAECVFENALVSGKNYAKVLKALETA